MSKEMIENIFNRVVFDEDDRKIHKAAYLDVKEVAERMDGCIVDSPEKTLVFRALHLALMHFGTALSKHPKYEKHCNCGI